VLDFETLEKCGTDLQASKLVALNKKLSPGVAPRFRPGCTETCEGPSQFRERQGVLLPLPEFRLIRHRAFAEITKIRLNNFDKPSVYCF
jgi:hypothetical protein